MGIVHQDIKPANVLIELEGSLAYIAPEDTRPLSALIYTKTKGNPFFVRQFIRSLWKKGLLEFNSSDMHWHWDFEKLENQQVTDNVVDLVAERIERLLSMMHW